MYVPDLSTGGEMDSAVRVAKSWGITMGFVMAAFKVVNEQPPDRRIDRSALKVVQELQRFLLDELLSFLPESHQRSVILAKLVKPWFSHRFFVVSPGTSMAFPGLFPPFPAWLATPTRNPPPLSFR